MMFFEITLVDDHFGVSVSLHVPSCLVPSFTALIFVTYLPAKRWNHSFSEPYDCQCCKYHNIVAPLRFQFINQQMLHASDAIIHRTLSQPPTRTPQ